MASCSVVLLYVAKYSGVFVLLLLSSEVQEEELVLVLQESTRLLPLGPTVRIDDGHHNIVNSSFF